jgi:hypothetical protein
MIARATGGALMVLGAALAALPAFAWYAAPGPAAPTRTSGFAGAGQLWLLPVPALAIVLCGALLIATRPGGERAAARVAGPVAVVAGALALVLVLWAALDPRLELVVALGDSTERIAVPVTVEPAAALAAALAGVVVGIGAVTAVSGWRR